MPLLSIFFVDWSRMPSTLYTHTLGTLCSVLDAYSAVLFLADAPVAKDGSAKYRMVGKFSLGDQIDTTAIIEPGKGLVGWIAKNDAPLFVPNFDQRQNNLGYYLNNEEQHIKAFMGCALPGGMGVLCVDSKRQYFFSEKDQKLLQLFAQLFTEQSASILHGKSSQLTLRHYTALKRVYTLRREHSRWGEFLQKFLELTVAATDCSYGVFCSNGPRIDQYGIEGETAPLVVKPRIPTPPPPMQGGIVGWVFRNGQPLYSNPQSSMPESSLFGKNVVTPQFHTIMALPIIIQKKTRGVLCLAKEIPLEISEETRDFTRMASEHLALFLENIYIKCRLRDVSLAAAALQEAQQKTEQ